MKAKFTDFHKQTFCSGACTCAGYLKLNSYFFSAAQSWLKCVCVSAWLTLFSGRNCMFVFKANY